MRNLYITCSGYTSRNISRSIKLWEVCKSIFLAWSSHNYYFPKYESFPCGTSKIILVLGTWDGSGSLGGRISNGFFSMYTAAHMYSSGGFEYFVKSGFEREPIMLHKQMIPHFKPLDVGSKISQEQSCSSIRDAHATFLVKSTLFKGEVAWQPLIEL